MRIVNEILNHCSVVVGGDKWTRPLDHVPLPSDSFKADVTILNTHPVSGITDIIWIEGDSNYIKEALQRVINQIDFIQKDMWERT